MENPTFEGQQREMTQQRNRGEKETGKTRTECYFRHRFYKDWWSVGSVPVAGKRKAKGLNWI